ncbi:unnamed protein product [Effrenium voratum]|nr:unnamed protein product [Effrenium voratum]
MNRTAWLHHGLGTISREEAEQRVQRNGLYLGASRDFWIIFFCCLGTIILCFLLTFGAVELRARRRKAMWGSKTDSDSEDSEAEHLQPELLTSKPVAKVGFIQRSIFKAQRYGPSFALHADLALRATLVAVFCAATYSPALPFLSWWQEQGWSMSYVVVILAFTLYLDLGSTVQSAWGGFYGTLLPVLNCWLMFAVYPHGVTDDDAGSYVFAWANFLIFVLLTFTLNLATLAKMYALSWQAYFTMCFLNPSDTTVFSRGLADVQLHAAETGALMGSIIGFLFAVLCAVVPTTISALDRAQDIVLDIAWTHGRLLERLIHLGGAQMHNQAAVVFGAEVKCLQQNVQEAKGLLATAWWECFDLGVAGRSRALLLELCKSLDFLNDWIEFMVMAVQHHDSDKVTNHIFVSVQKELSALVRESKGSLFRCVAVAIQGDLAAESDLTMSLSALEEAQRNLTAAFRRSLSQVPLQQVFTFGQLPELALASSVSGYSQLVGTLASELLVFEPFADKPSLTEQLRGLCSFSALGCGRRKFLETMKLLVAYLACFALGRSGIGGFLPPFNSTAPGTVSYLIFQGGDQAAALKKNSDRFMGVGLGSLMGVLLLGSSCGISSLVGVWMQGIFLIAYFVLEFMGFYMYFASPSFFYVGLMFCCFFASSALDSCNQLKSDSTSNFQSMLSQLLAILIATLMDVTTDRSLSIRATQNLEAFVDVMDRALDTYPISKRKARRALREEGLGLLAAARADGQEAAREPRLLQVPWREELWTKVLVLCEEAWQCLTLVSCTASPETPQERCFQKAVDVLLSSPSFAKEVQILRSRALQSFELVIDLFRQTHYDDTSSGQAELVGEFMDSRKCHAHALPKILSETVARLNVQAAQEAHTLLDHEICAVAMFIMLLEALGQRIEQLEVAVLEQPQMWQLLEPS